ncbi:FMN-linked oxidoreductase [Lentinus tigrinus ALCF2SS1-7]|uniref:FMN-linked oxidoreductase n=1 Tax=Lentinus tigrinus ALCF2SS1-6 TaxID=1328759 RepID=A0A5C2RQU9_9APHY|nr:FMN-linked oxidoreductase [Lentinus tigrinus ALCF2SS1-6]RPD79667.1 FMN-linked oxidoreductase [Lentinus tigrinus ALCF2SS1-7]
MSPQFNSPAPNVSYFIPAQYPPAGTPFNPQSDGKPIPTLFQPIKIRGVEFQNRIWLSPLAQYSSENGIISPWQDAHLGGILTRGPGLTMVEANGISPEGRVSPEDAGIWSDEQERAWSRIVQFAHSQGQKIGIQINHGGRKASTVSPFVSRGPIADELAGGWPDNVWGPTEEAYSPEYPKPKALTEEGIRRVVAAFVNAAKHAVRAGFDVLDIHGAHGYLISSFLNPTSNRRTDEYGGSFENRIRFPLEVVDAVRAVIPPTMPLFFRISATEWLEEVFPDEPSWRSEDTVRFAEILAAHGVDLIDISSGGSSPAARISPLAHGPGYQVPFAAAVKQAHGDKILVSAVGGIRDGKFAQSILDEGKADVVFVGRMFQKNPGLVWSFADDLGVELHHSRQIGWGFQGRARSTSQEK